jgi:hypothetical protein
MKLLIIITIILITIFIDINYFNNVNEKENFQVTLVNFPMDFNFDREYLEGFNTSDINARNLKGNLQDIYQGAIVEPSMTQKIICQDIVDTIMKKVPERRQKAFLKSGWNLVLVKNLENNFPHTHGNNIIYPLNRLKNDENAQITFIHEKAHNYQKTNAAVFYKLYTQYWGFKRSNKIQIPFDVRSNPDTPDLYWSFNNCLLLVKYNDNPKDLNDVIHIAYDIYTGKYVELRKWKPFTDFFGTSDDMNYYHPDEISATMISNYCYGYEEKTPAFKKFKEWFKHLA